MTEIEDLALELIESLIKKHEIKKIEDFICPVCKTLAEIFIERNLLKLEEEIKID
jgi:hypothetical protein